jgi:hypothetical protein
MYTVDMVHGFAAMDRLKNSTLSFEQQFAQVFPGQAIPRPRTYKDHVLKWNRGNHDLKEQFLKAGRTSLGHWAKYSKLVPLK